MHTVTEVILSSVTQRLKIMQNYNNVAVLCVEATISSLSINLQI